MRLYRKIVPKIARDLIRTLSANEMIEIEDGHNSEAELDVAAVMVEYLNAEENVIKETRETLSRRGISPERFTQVKKSVAEARGVKVGDEGIEYVFNQVLEVLFASKNVAEIYAEDNVIRKEAKLVMDKYILIPEEVDAAARARIKNLREGSPEWDIEYPRVVAQIKRQKGLL